MRDQQSLFHTLEELTRAFTNSFGSTVLPRSGVGSTPLSVGAGKWCKASMCVFLSCLVHHCTRQDHASSSQRYHDNSQLHRAMEGSCLVDVEMMLESFCWPELESQGYLWLGAACSSLMERAIAVLVSLFLIQNGKCSVNYYKKIMFPVK